jgi:hypothetical protein
MTEYSSTETINPSTQQPTHDIEVSKAFLRRLHSEVDPAFEALYATYLKYLEVVRKLYPDIPTAVM